MTCCIDTKMSPKAAMVPVYISKIDTGDASPIRETARRQPMTKREIAEQIIQSMVQVDVINDSNNIWSILLVLVKTKDESTSFFVD